MNFITISLHMSNKVHYFAPVSCANKVLINRVSLKEFPPLTEFCFPQEFKLVSLFSFCLFSSSIYQKKKKKDLHLAQHFPTIHIIQRIHYPTASMQVGKINGERFKLDEPPPDTIIPFSATNNIISLFISIFLTPNTPCPESSLTCVPTALGEAEFQLLSRRN